jgi:hypothetical protein
VLWCGASKCKISCTAGIESSPPSVEVETLLCAQDFGCALDTVEYGIFDRPGMRALGVFHSLMSELFIVEVFGGDE